MKFGSMFSGVGGFDLGLEASGMSCSFQIELDKACQNVLNYHWPQVPKWHDISEVNGADLPACDLVAFGSPCQDLSVAGGRKGLEGKRSGLFYEALRVIGELHAAKPIRYVVWENVPGALSSNRGKDFGSVLDGLAELGALAVEWAVLDAQYFGVAQRRRRVFVLAELAPRTTEQGTEQIFSIKQGSRRHNKASDKTRQNNAARADEGAKGNSQRPYVKSRRAKSVDDYETWIESEISPTLNTFDNAGESRATVLLPLPIQGTIINRSDTAGPQGKGIGKSDGPMYTLDTVSQHGVAQPIIFENSYRDGIRLNNAVVPTLQADHHDAPYLAVSPTLSAKMGTGGLNVPMLSIGDEQKMIVRRLMPIECERLMGWPDDHTRFKAPGIEQPDTTRYKQIGNGVASPVAQWLGEQIMKLERFKNA